MLQTTFLSLILLLFCSCSSGVRTDSNALDGNTSARKDDEKKKHEKDKDNDERKTDSNEANPSAPAGDCTNELWTHVYNARRLKVMETCKVVTGTVAERKGDEDGDEHMLLKLDPAQQYLLSEKNISRKEGNLVIEAVCVNPTRLAKVGSTCNGFLNPVQLPNVGDHVRITGAYVLDSHNGWMEIHPVSKVEKTN